MIVALVMLLPAYWQAGKWTCLLRQAIKISCKIELAVQNIKLKKFYGYNIYSIKLQTTVL